MCAISSGGGQISCVWRAWATPTCWTGETPLAFVITSMDLQFLKAARIDDALIVRTTYDALRGPRLTIRQTIERGSEVLCRAEVEAAVIDLTGRPRRAPATLIAAVTPWLKPDPV